MAKYQVLKRVAHSIDGVAGEMVEFVQIPDEGISQVQIYFVPENKTDADILGVATKHHEDELKAKNIVFQGAQSPMNGIASEVEPMMEVEVKAGKVTVKEVVSE